MSLWQRLGRAWSQLFCRHEITLSDYLVTIDERGIQHKVDYCAICGQVSPKEETGALGGQNQ